MEWSSCIVLLIGVVNSIYCSRLECSDITTCRECILQQCVFVKDHQSFLCASKTHRMRVSLQIRFLSHCKLVPVQLSAIRPMDSPSESSVSKVTNRSKKVTAILEDHKDLENHTNVQINKEITSAQITDHRGRKEEVEKEDKALSNTTVLPLSAHSVTNGAAILSATTLPIAYVESYNAFRSDYLCGEACEVDGVERDRGVTTVAPSFSTTENVKVIHNKEHTRERKKEEEKDKTLSSTTVLPSSAHPVTEGAEILSATTLPIALAESYNASRSDDLCGEACEVDGVERDRGVTTVAPSFSTTENVKVIHNKEHTRERKKEEEKDKSLSSTTVLPSSAHSVTEGAGIIPSTTLPKDLAASSSVESLKAAKVPVVTALDLNRISTQNFEHGEKNKEGEVVETLSSTTVLPYSSHSEIRGTDKELTSVTNIIAPRNDKKMELKTNCGDDCDGALKQNEVIHFMKPPTSAYEMSGEAHFPQPTSSPLATKMSSVLIEDGSHKELTPGYLLSSDINYETTDLQSTTAVIDTDSGVLTTPVTTPVTMAQEGGTTVMYERRVKDYAHRQIRDNCRVSVHNNQLKQFIRHNIVTPEAVIKRRIQKCVRLMKKLYTL